MQLSRPCSLKKFNVDVLEHVYVSRHSTLIAFALRVYNGA